MTPLTMRQSILASELKDRLRQCWLAAEDADDAARIATLGESDVLALADRCFELLCPAEYESAAIEAERRRGGHEAI